jgi:hypothetical protein
MRAVVWHQTTQLEKPIAVPVPDRRREWPPAPCFAWGKRARLLFDNWQSPPAHAIPIDDNNALRDINFAEGTQDFAQASDHVRLAPVAIPKQNKARLGGSSQRKQAWIIKIGGHNGPAVLLRAHHDFDVRSMLQPQFESMDGIMPLLSKPRRQIRRKRHVDQELHDLARPRKLNRLVFCEGSSVAQSLVDIARFEIGVRLENLLSRLTRRQ